MSPPLSAPSTQLRGSSLARKYSQFTVVLLIWVVMVFFAFDLRGDLDWQKLALMAVVVPFVAWLISKFTNHLLASPLVRLQKGILAVEQGRLEPIQISRTGDEIEYLGESLNAMIAALKASQAEVREYQEMLEERIRQRTEALEEATQRALAANRYKSEFLANISHELRTPMNGVLGMIDIVLDDELPPHQREQLETAKNCANTLLALLNDLLDLSKIESGKMLLEQIQFDLRSLAQDCVKSMAARARQKGIALACVIAPDLPPMVVGDPLRVRQVLTNLLSNAVKFTEKGSVELTVAVKNASPSRLTVAMAVKDTGMGIPAEKLSAIFEEFTQADGSVSRKFGGTGLGLAITRRLVELHGGTIGVESHVWTGSRFLVELVVGTPVEVTQEGTAPLEPPKPSPTPARARILVVEDNLVNQKVVSALLGKQGYDVCLANNGREGLETLDSDNFDLVLMDVQMPELDGISAARQIRQQPRWKDVPIIAMTAHAMNGDRERCLEAGMNGYLSKPVVPGHLVEAVRLYLKNAGPRSAAPESPAPVDLPSPVDLNMATHPMEGDTELMAGMSLLFLQIAPERLRKLKSAAVRLDTVSVQTQARNLAKTAERIAAIEVARRARELAISAPSQNYAAIQDALAGLECEIERFERHVRSRPAPQSPEHTEALAV